MCWLTVKIPWDLEEKCSIFYVNKPKMRQDSTQRDMGAEGTSRMDTIKQNNCLFVLKV